MYIIIIYLTFNCAVAPGVLSVLSEHNKRNVQFISEQ
jgi:hypothetical protein